MSAARNVLAAAADAIRAAEPGELPAIVGELEALKAMVWSRITAPAVAPAPAPPAAWITPERAAEIAALPMATDDERRRSVGRIYRWARGKRWASRPSTRCLRIAEDPFRRWLAAQAAAA